MIGIGNYIGRKTGISFSSFWASRSECYEIWKITGAGNLIGEKRGDILTVGGSAGSYTFQVPNTATYQTYDTDNIWFTIVPAQRTVTESELVSYDFGKTIVKYLDIYPYSIEYIMILASSPAGDIENKMRDDFHLSIWWSNVLSSHGNVKGNRGVGKSVWSTSYADYLARLVAIGETPDATRQTLLDHTIVALQAASLFETKFDAMYFLAADADASSRLNLIQDAFNLTKQGLPAFQVDRGFTGGAGKALKTGLIPASGGLKFAANSASIGAYCRTDQDGDYRMLGTNGTGNAGITYIDNRQGNFGYLRINSLTGDVKPANNDGRGMYIGTRNSDTNVYWYKNNAGKTGKIMTYNGLSNYEFYILALNNIGTLTSPLAGQLAFAFIGGALSDADVANIQTIIVDGYLTSIGANV